MNLTRLSEIHNEALLALTEACRHPQEKFHTCRRPDFFELPRGLGDATYYGILRGDKLIAAAGVTAQRRMLKGKTETVHYLHDVRVHPAHSGSRAYYQLICGLKARYGTSPGWMFAVVLEQNPFAKVVAGKSRLLPSVKQVGTIVHVGFPLFCGTKRTAHSVRQISAENAWTFFSRCTQQTGFAPADKTIFESSGAFLGIERNGALVSACKLVDQDHARKIIRSQPASFPERLVNRYCRVRGCTGLPGKNETFRHLHLSYYVSADGDHRGDYVAYARKHYAGTYSYVFAGMSAGTAASYRHLFLLRFRSHVYTYGNAPTVSFQFPELTLI